MQLHIHTHTFMKKRIQLIKSFLIERCHQNQPGKCGHDFMIQKFANACKRVHSLPRFCGGQPFLWVGSSIPIVIFCERCIWRGNLLPTLEFLRSPFEQEWKMQGGRSLRSLNLILKSLIFFSFTFQMATFQLLLKCFDCLLIFIEIDTNQLKTSEMYRFLPNALILQSMMNLFTL